MTDYILNIIGTLFSTLFITYTGIILILLFFKRNKVAKKIMIIEDISPGPEIMLASLCCITLGESIVNGVPFGELNLGGIFAFMGIMFMGAAIVVSVLFFAFTYIRSKIPEES